MKIGAVVIVLYLTTVEFLSGAQLNQRCITTGAPKLYKLYASCPSSSAAILNRAFGMKGKLELVKPISANTKFLMYCLERRLQNVLLQCLNMFLKIFNFENYHFTQAAQT